MPKLLLSPEPPLPGSEFTHDEASMLLYDQNDDTGSSSEASDTLETFHFPTVDGDSFTSLSGEFEEMLFLCMSTCKSYLLTNENLRLSALQTEQTVAHTEQTVSSEAGLSNDVRAEDLNSDNEAPHAGKYILIISRPPLSEIIFTVNLNLTNPEKTFIFRPKFYLVQNTL